MKAYNLTMLWIFICYGFVVMDSIGVFGSYGEEAAIAQGFAQFLVNPIIQIPIIGFDVTGMIAIATAMALATVIILNTNIVTDRGIAYSVFVVVFWGSFILAITVMSKIHFPGIELFYMIFLVAASYIFINALVNLPLGRTE